MSILDKTAVELNALSKAQMVTAIIDEQTAIRAEQRISKVISQSGDKRGMLEMTTGTVDGNGNLIGNRQAFWTYWPKGNVRDITIIERDGTGAETSRQVVKHRESGGLLPETKVVIGAGK